MNWAAVFAAAALFLLIWKAARMVWLVRYRPKGTVVYSTAPSVVTPVFSVAPVISGTPALGQTLTATTGLASGSPTYSIQWRRNGTAISGATGGTYVVQAADQGTTLTVAVTATIGLVSATAVSLGVSIAPAVVPAPVFSVAPVITGTPIEGQTLSSSTGTASGSPSYALQWKRNGSAISGATSPTYLLVTADVGTVITVTSTATNAGGSVSSTSSATATIAAAASAGFPATVNGLLTPFTLTLAAEDQTTYPPPFILANLDDVAAADVLWIISTTDDARTAGRLEFYHTVTDADLDAPEPRSWSFPGLSAITTGTRRYWPVLQRGSARSDYGTKVTHGPDDVAPVLTAASAPSGITASGATVTVTTDTPEGTLYMVLSSANTRPSNAQIKAGQTHTGAAATFANSQAVTSTGAKSVVVAGGSGATPYYPFWLHRDVAGNEGLFDGASFTTLAGGSSVAKFYTTAADANRHQNAIITGSGLILTVDANVGDIAAARVDISMPQNRKYELALTDVVDRIYFGIADRSVAFGANFVTNKPGHADYSTSAGFTIIAELGQMEGRLFYNGLGNFSYQSLALPTAVADSDVWEVSRDPTLAAKFSLKCKQGGTTTSFGPFTMTSQIPSDYTAFAGGRMLGDKVTLNAGASAFAISGSLVGW